MRAIFRGLLPCAAMLLVGATYAGAPVEIAVTGVSEARGNVHVELCPEKQFLGACPYVGNARAQQGTTIVTIANVPPGRYAAQGYHDANANGKADRNFLGLPTEAVGFSNNAMTRLARPQFSVAAFDHGPAAQRISFAMRKFL